MAFVVILIVFIGTVAAVKLDGRAKEEAAMQAHEKAQKTADDQRLAAEQQELEQRRERQRTVAAENKAVSDRCKAAQGMDIYMAYKTGDDQTIRAVDSGVNRIPSSVDELKALPPGDCTVAIMYFNQVGATTIAQGLIDQPKGFADTLADAHFTKVIIMDPETICYAYVLPRIGVGKMSCVNR